MAAPDYVPVTLADQPRQDEPAKPPDSWRADRPGDLGPRQPVGPKLGRQGPDQGYALSLARRFADKLHVFEGESTDDAVAGCVAVALKRASLFGRAPVIHDLDIAFRIWGFLTEAPAELVEFRKVSFESCATDYSAQRTIVDRVPEDTLRLTHGEVARRFPGEWRVLLGLSEF